MKQSTLFDAYTEPRAQQPATIPALDPHVDAREQPRLGRKNLAILERLRQGPATNGELVGITHRFSARIWDLNQAGFTIEIIETDHASGMRRYALTNDPWK